MAKLVIQGRASPRDADFDDVTVDGKPFHVFFTESGIHTMLKDDKNSCHKRPDYIDEFRISIDGGKKTRSFVDQDLKGLVQEGHPVVIIEAGGLAFDKPASDAAHMPTVPIIAVPLGGSSDPYGGVAAFVSQDVPDSTAVSGNVGLSRYDTAARAARAMLGGFERIACYDSGVVVHDGVQNFLNKMRGYDFPEMIDATKDDVGPSDLVLAVIDFTDPEKGADELLRVDEMGAMVVFTLENRPTLTHLEKFMDVSQQLQKSIYVNRPRNVATYGAKIWALHDPTMAEKLRDEQQATASDPAYSRGTIGFPKDFRVVK